MSSDMFASQAALDEVKETLHWRLRYVEEQVEQIQSSAGAIQWLAPNFTEPHVQIALGDLCKPGDTVFDVGTNFGGLALTMSRRVGPRGVVCAFEANPKIAAMAQQSLVRWGCGNVQIYHNAVFHTSNTLLELFVSENQVSDSLYNRVSDKTIKVLSLALDDFVEETGLVPGLVKMDIEGAEYDVLLGFEKTLARHRPVLVLEQQPSDPRCLNFLRERGYLAIDLRTYKVLESMDQLAPGTVVTDILYAPPEKLQGTPYAPPYPTTEVTRLTAADFSWQSDTVLLTREPMQWQPGRYLITADFMALSPTVELKVGLAEQNIALMRYHGTSGWLARVARDWVMDIAYPRPIDVFFDFPGGRDDSFALNSILIRRIDTFDALHRPAWR